ncbi:MAG: hypothetical protein U9R47_04775 [Actinomycetota bacterium]|nr:hypothetical protein [Actinomycetota bacterium]
MTAERLTEPTTTLRTVAFIDTWLDDNAMWVDSRVLDFALDVRTLLSSDSSAPNETREPVGADA